MTHKAALAGQSTGSILNSTSTESMSSELTALLLQYQALNAAAGLAANQEIGNGLLTSAGIDTSALLQLQLLQAFQRQTAELAALPAFSMVSWIKRLFSTIFRRKKQSLLFLKINLKLQKRQLQT